MQLVVHKRFALYAPKPPVDRRARFGPQSSHSYLHRVLAPRFSISKGASSFFSAISGFFRAKPYPKSQKNLFAARKGRAFSFFSGRKKFFFLLAPRNRGASLTRQGQIRAASTCLQTCQGIRTSAIFSGNAAMLLRLRGQRIQDKQTEHGAQQHQPRLRRHRPILPRPRRPPAGDALPRRRGARARALLR